MTERKRLLSIPYIHTFQTFLYLQCDHIRTFLMHSGKVHARKIYKGKMCGKDNFVRFHTSTESFHLMSSDFCHQGIFIYRQIPGKRLQKLQRMERSLMRKPHCSCAGNRDFNLLLKGRIDPQFPGCFCLLSQFFFIRRINVRITLCQVTINSFFPDNSLVLFHCILISLYIIFRLFFAFFLQKSIAEHSMLGCDLCRSILSLASADLICFQNDRAYPGLFQLPCRKDSCYASADHSHICPDLSRQSRSLLSLAGFAPYRIHYLSPMFF